MEQRPSERGPPGEGRGNDQREGVDTQQGSAADSLRAQRDESVSSSDNDEAEERSTDDSSSDGSGSGERVQRDEGSDAEIDAGSGRPRRSAQGWEEFETEETQEPDNRSDSASDEEEESDKPMTLFDSLTYLSDFNKKLEEYLINFQNQHQIGMWALTRGIEFPSSLHVQQPDETGRQLEQTLQPLIRCTDGKSIRVMFATLVSASLISFIPCIFLQMSGKGSQPYVSLITSCWKAMMKGASGVVNKWSD